jgi:hypothetical protein
VTNVSEIHKPAITDERRDVLLAGITAAIEYARHFDFNRQARRDAFLCGYLARHGDGDLLAAIKKILKRK